MRKALLTSVAAVALIAGGGMVAAQDIKPDTKSNAPSASEQKTQSPAAAPEMKRAPNAQMSPSDSKADRAQSKEMDKNKPSTAQSKEMDKDKPSTAQSKDMDKNKPSSAQTKDMNAPNRSNAQTDTNKSSTTNTTVNNTTKNTNVSLTTEQRTKIRTTVLKASNAPRVAHVDFNVSVGTRVPTSVHVVAVPETVVEVHPQWRGYLYFIVGDQIVIIEPDTHEIVAVISA